MIAAGLYTHRGPPGVVSDGLVDGLRIVKANLNCIKITTVCWRKDRQTDVPFTPLLDNIINSRILFNAVYSYCRSFDRCGFFVTRRSFTVRSISYSLAGEFPYSYSEFLYSITVEVLLINALDMPYLSFRSRSGYDRPQCLVLVPET